ncbi:hypothetical protein GIB67_004906 [Kingdonia uniflora]|uniref:DUF4408 domain-containing protein n=1 Tax=Kingdonia uniflora TaxID=39325 RepID=A0A7J7LNM3_9MAGN|nr:hypothetical protein GIB67_004906 [Kingdonia uniflora]
MDTFDYFDNIKAEKSKAMIKYNRLRKIRNLFRLIELLLALVLLTWVTTQLPFAIKAFKQLLLVLISPKFVFLIGNAIVVTLFAKSRNFSNQNPPSGTQIYEEFVKNSEKYHVLQEEEVLFEDKQTVCEEKTTTVKSFDVGRKTFRRTQSEKVKANNNNVCERLRKELRRSETDVCANAEVLSEKSREREGGRGQEMSNEEFQKAIDEFIARQMRFRREETMAVVLLD